jgi:hypothetical protein
LFKFYSLTRCSQMFQILCTKDVKSDEKEETDWWHLRWLSDMVFSLLLPKMMLYCHHYCCREVRRVCSNLLPRQDVGLNNSWLYSWKHRPWKWLLKTTQNGHFANAIWMLHGHTILFTKHSDITPLLNVREPLNWQTLVSTWNSV